MIKQKGIWSRINECWLNMDSTVEKEYADLVWLHRINENQFGKQI